MSERCCMPNHDGPDRPQRTAPRDRDGVRNTEPAWRRYLRFLRPNPAADLDDELRDHLESTAEELIAGGMPPDAARAEAARRFGDASRVRDVVQRIDQR